MFRRPVIHHPVRYRVGRRTSRTTRKTHHRRNIQHAGKLQGLTKLLRSLPRLGGIGIQRVVVAAQRHDGNTAVVKLLLPGARLSRVSYQLGARTMRRAIRTGGANLHSLNAHAGEPVQHVVQGELVKRRVEHSNRQALLGADGLSCAADCAGADTESGAEANAAAVVPRNCRRFMKHSRTHK